jgi:PAS domain S-box-containing protein
MYKVLKSSEYRFARTSRMVLNGKNMKSPSNQDNLFHEVFNGIPYGILILDRNKRCSSANTAAARLLGISRQKLIGSKITELLKPKHGSTRAPLWNVILRSPAKEFDFQYERGDRSLEIGVKAKANFHPGSHLVVLHDITVRKRAEEAGRKQSQMLDFANDTIMIRDLKDRIVYWNQGAERLYGWSRKQAVGQYVHTFLHTVFPEPLRDVLDKFFRTGHWQGLLIHSKKDGFPVTVSSRWTLQRDEHGRPSAFLEINNDISERVKAEEALQRAHHELERRVLERTAELSKANARLKALSARLFTAQEEERWRISRDLHDDLGQILTSMNLNLERALRLKDVAKSRNLLNNVLAANLEARNRLRELSSLLRPRVLDDVGLKEAIETYVSEFETRTGVRSQVALRCGNNDFNDAASTNIYRILQEALTNISKHSSAKRVSIQLQVSNGKAIFKIKDNGNGFNPNSIRVEKTLGLLGMKERAELMGGDFVIRSSINKGTELSVSFPTGGSRRTAHP